MMSGIQAMLAKNPENKRDLHLLQFVADNSVNCLLDAVQKSSQFILNIFDYKNDVGDHTGPLQKLRKIVKAIRESPSSRERWRHALQVHLLDVRSKNGVPGDASYEVIPEDEAIPVLDVGGRVEAVYDMIYRFLSLENVSQYTLSNVPYLYEHDRYTTSMSSTTHSTKTSKTKIGA